MCCSAGLMWIVGFQTRVLKLDVGSALLRADSTLLPPTPVSWWFWWALDWVLQALGKMVQFLLSPILAICFSSICLPSCWRRERHTQVNSGNSGQTLGEGSQQLPQSEQGLRKQIFLDKTQLHVYEETAFPHSSICVKSTNSALSKNEVCVLPLSLPCQRHIDFFLWFLGCVRFFYFQIKDPVRSLNENPCHPPTSLLPRVSTSTWHLSMTL